MGRRRKPEPAGPPPVVWPPAALVTPNPADWPSFDALLAAREAWQRDHELPPELWVPWRWASVQDDWRAVAPGAPGWGPPR